MNKSIEYIRYEKIIEYLDIKEGDILYIPSQILRLARACKKTGEEFDANKLIESFQQKIGQAGTILIPTFNWEFSNKGSYDYHNSPSTTGALGNIALQRTDFRRTQNPIHSFAVWGKYQEELCKLNNQHSYDEKSPFEFLRKHGAKCLIFGTDYCHAYTFIHYVEYCEKVPFRYDKIFSGIYITEAGEQEERTYSLYVRNLNLVVKENFNKIGMLMEQSGIAVKKYINDEPYILIDIARSYDIIAKDIKENNCSNLYLFE